MALLASVAHLRDGTRRTFGNDRTQRRMESGSCSRTRCPILRHVLPVVAAGLLAAWGSAGNVAAQPSPGTIETLQSIAGLPVGTCNTFHEPAAIQQAASGAYFVFDRRDHAVYSVPPDGHPARRIVEVGGEGGRLLMPTAFALSPDGRTFVVADAPRRQERLQIFDSSGMRVAGFSLPGRARTRVSIGGVALGGVSTVAHLGTRLAINLPETGALITEFGFGGTPVGSIGRLRATGHEDDRQLHLALNEGIPLPHPEGGYYFVFYSGAPVFRRYDTRGALVFERVMQGRELDPIVASMPERWPRRSDDGRETPLVVPTVRAAAVDPAGRLWISFVTPFTYVFDATGEKIRTVQFRGAGIVAPTSLSFTPSGRLLVTPGCYAFDPAFSPPVR